MRYFVILCGLGMLACLGGGGPDSEGPAGTDIVLKNDYADSLFTATYTVDGGAAQTAFTNERIEGYRSKTFSDAIVAPAGAPVELTLVGTSLGENYTFVLKGTKPASTVTITYDYDVATANFSIASTWGVNQ